MVEVGDAAPEFCLPAGDEQEDALAHTVADGLRFIFKRNTPQLVVDGIKGIRIQLRDGSASQL